LQIEIDARIAAIEQLDQQIKERMVNIQSFVSLDQYIEFIMGASDFVDLLRRTSAINDIMDYDTNQIKKLEEEKATLAQNQAELEEQKEGLDKERATLVKTKKSLKTARADQEELKNYYLSQKTKLESEKRKNVNDLDDLLDALDDISKALGAVVPSAGWILPIKTGWYISAGAFYYPASFGGGVHLGVDFAASSSRKIRAVANGVILYVYDRCGSGYYGNACGGVWGGGNMVVYAVSVGSKTYGVQLCHMSRGVSKYVKAGDIVTQGTTLGYVGTSGNSTGNHLHIELYDLGKKSLATVAKEFSKKGDVTFGTGWYSLSTTCDNKKTTPCRLNPQKIFNVKVGQSG
ncbi:MAG: peptidoglycan DD-metalloendopeptidase family protein, partial [Erysipelotrichaceae bacterium]|nr:peptidoglycan DD-metalloendopeptidase family protein [Erysipelotrichaceae bacterium]